MTLACELAEQLRSHHEQARNSAARPGGMNYLLPPNIPTEVVSSILFYAIAAANNGWANAKVVPINVGALTVSAAS